MTRCGDFLKKSCLSKNSSLPDTSLFPRAKKWFVEELETSDYETIQNYIKRAKREGLKNWKSTLKNARRMWTFSKYKAPENWSADDVHDYLMTLSAGERRAEC